MRSDQQGYDRGVTVFSPDGRLYQVEYAREAVERGSPVVGVCADEAVVFAASGPRRSSLMAAESIEKIHDLDGRLGAASAGHVADGRRLVDVGREFAQRERLRYGEPPRVESVAKAIADFVQETTQTGGTRPFGAALLVGGVDGAPDPLTGESPHRGGDSVPGAVDSGPRLYEVDPSGAPTEYHAAAVGHGADESRAFLETEYEPGLDRAGGTTLALEALAESVDEPTAAELDLALLDADGIDSFGPERRASALDDAGLAAS